MIVSSAEYLAALHQIQDKNRPHQLIYIPKDKPIYEVNLNERSVAAPDVLSVEYDHNSSSVFFIVDRFYENIDLSTMTCIIQYKNANPNTKNSGYIYAVPFYDITTFSQQDKMVFSWDIEGPATAYKGKVEFSIKFYRTSKNIIVNNENETEEVIAYDYILNTMPAFSKVLEGMNIYEASDNYFLEVEIIEAIYERIKQVETRNSDIYWINLYDKDIVIDNIYPPNTINKNENIYNNIG